MTRIVFRNATLVLLAVLTVLSANGQTASINGVGGKAGVLIVGKRNQIQVNKPANAKVKVARGELVSLGNGEYYVTEHYCGFPNHDTVTVHIGSEVLAQKVFRLVYDGAPLLAINGKTCYDSIKANDLYKDNRLTIVNDSLKHKVTHFEITVMKSRAEMVGPVQYDGDKIPLDLIKSFKEGDKVWIENITTAREDGSKSTLKLASIRLLVIERFNLERQCNWYR